jgi:predicted transcriptional regulator
VPRCNRSATGVQGRFALSSDARLREAGFKQAVAVDAGKLVGVISLTDIAQVAPEDWSSVTVEDVMTAEPTSVAATETPDVNRCRTWLNQPPAHEDALGQVAIAGGDKR